MHVSNYTSMRVHVRKESNQAQIETPTHVQWSHAHVHLHTHMHESLCIYTYKNVYVHVFVSFSFWMKILHTCICIYIRIYTYIYIARMQGNDTIDKKKDLTYCNLQKMRIFNQFQQLFVPVFIWNSVRVISIFIVTCST